MGGCNGCHIHALGGRVVRSFGPSHEAVHATGGQIMTIVEAIALALALGLGAYLIYALLKAEDF